MKSTEFGWRSCLLPTNAGRVSTKLQTVTSVEGQAQRERELALIRSWEEREWEGEWERERGREREWERERERERDREREWDNVRILQEMCVRVPEQLLGEQSTDQIKLTHDIPGTPSLIPSLLLNPSLFLNISHSFSPSQYLSLLFFLYLYLGLRPTCFSNFTRGQRGRVGYGAMNCLDCLHKGNVVVMSLPWTV